MSEDLVTEFQKAMSRLPGVGAKVAEQAAEELHDLAQGQWSAGQNPFGDPFGEGKTGPITLERTGAMKASEEFVPVGENILCRVSVPYAKYQLKHGFLPRGSAIPQSWEKAISTKAEEALMGALK